MYLSSNFTLEEAIHSQTAARLGIQNMPAPMVLENMKLAARKLEQVRTMLDNRPVLVSSWFRSPDLNEAVKGSKTSAHMYGWAIDFTAPSFGSVNQIIDRLRASGLDYDQVINEFNGSWCHISFDPQYRKQALIIDQDGTRAYA